MSYVYQHAMVREIGVNKPWSQVDISTMTIATILKHYTDVYVVLTNPYVQGMVTFELTQHRNLILRPELTLNAWLVFNGNTTLPTTVGVPTITKHTAQYAAAHQVHFHVSRVHPDTHPDMQHPDSTLTDILLTRDNTDYATLQRSAMVNVCGLFHRTESTLHGLYVKHGGETGIKSNDNSVGLLSLAAIGDISYIPITEDNLYKLNTDQPYAKRAYIDTQMDLDNKTVLLVLGGVLYLLDGTYSHIGNGQIAIRTERINWLRTFSQLRHRINLQSMIDVMPTTLAQQALSEGYDGIFSIAELLHDDAISAFLRLPQSFLVVVDTPYINTRTVAVESTCIPGVVVAYQKPIGILQQRNGITVPYTRVKQHHLWSLQYKPEYQREFYFETTDWDDLSTTNDTQEILSLHQSGYGRLIEINKEVLTIGS